jgi:hypothetical protein
MMITKKRKHEEAALPSTEGNAANENPTLDEVKKEDVQEVSPFATPPPLPEKAVPELKADPPPPQPVVEKPMVPFKVFVASCGVKWDQMAGFKSFVKRTKLGPLTIAQWREAFADFQKRPVG